MRRSEASGAALFPISAAKKITNADVPKIIVDAINSGHVSSVLNWVGVNGRSP